MPEYIWLIAVVVVAVAGIAAGFIISRYLVNASSKKAAEEAEQLVASAKRQAEVDAIRAKMEAAGADRFAIQDALMPYQDLLPKRLKGKNERVDEPLKD